MYLASGRTIFLYFLFSRDRKTAKLAQHTAIKFLWIQINPGKIKLTFQPLDFNSLALSKISLTDRVTLELSLSKFTFLKGGGSIFSEPNVSILFSFELCVRLTADGKRNLEFKPPIPIGLAIDDDEDCS
uniref:Uncharacterized protein n=1 Tax=Romanomermis culicivorax TaxID=13658 RepID=A0A915HHN5_ROMCU